MLTEPHKEQRTRSQGDDSQNPEEPAGVVDDNFARRSGKTFKEFRHHETLNETQNNRAVSCPLGYLFVTLLTLFLPFADLRNDNRKKRHDDRGTDIRHDSEREYRKVFQSTAAEHIEHAEKRSVRFRGHNLFHDRTVYAGRRYEYAEPVDTEHHQSKENFVSEIRNLENVF